MIAALLRSARAGQRRAVLLGMAAAAAAGYGWPTVCESNASCGTCVSIVEEGAENCGPMPADEEETLTRTLVPALAQELSMPG